MAWVLVGLTAACAHREPEAILALPSDALRARLLPGLAVAPAARSGRGDEVDAVVVLGYDLGPEGRVLDTRVLYALPAGFEGRAASDLARWRFSPVPSRRRDRRIRLTYRGPPDALKVTAAVPAPGDCDAGVMVRGSGEQRWALVSCSTGLLKEVAVEGLVGWRSLGRQRPPVY